MVTVSGMSMGRQEAFDVYKRDYHQNVAIENTKQTLKQRYSQAKHLGEIVNQTRTNISKQPSAILSQL